MAIDRPRPEDVEGSDSAPEAVESPEEDPWARTDGDRERDFADAARLVRGDLERSPRLWHGRPSETDKPLRPATSSEDDVEQSDDLSEADRRVAELRLEGHGPQRHLDLSDDQLRQRLGTPEVGPDGKPVLKPNGEVASRDHIDPMTGTTVDGVHGRSHRGADVATAFSNPIDFVSADTYFRGKVTNDGRLQPSATIEDVLGRDAEGRMRGFRHDRGEAGRYAEVDFAGGSIKAIYRRSDAGDLLSITMYPVPAPDQQMSGDTDES